MQKFKQMKLTNQLLLLILSALTVMALVLVIYSGSQFTRSENIAKHTLAAYTSASVIEKIDRHLYERFSDVQAFAYNDFAIKKLAETSISETINFQVTPTDSPAVTSASGFMSDNELQNYVNTMTAYYAVYDLILICDLEGNIKAVNTIDKKGTSINTEFLLDQNIAKEEWFTACTSSNGFENGVWYSDFTVNQDVATIYQSNGWGVGFAAPIKDKMGRTLGVWYNFTNWESVTAGIRKEEEAKIRQSNKDAYIFITNRMGEVIDAEENTMILHTTINQERFEATKETFKAEGITISAKDYQYAWAKSVGSTNYKGKGWKVITVIPSSKVTFQTFFSKNLVGLLIFAGIILVLSAWIGFRFSKKVADRINAINQVIKKLSLGELNKTDINGQDEIGQIGNSVNSLTSGLKRTVEFAEKIGKGTFDTEYKLLSDKDTLGHALLDMRNNLVQFSEEDKKRNWATEGIAQFAEILRAHESSEELCNKIISNLVKYLKANQGYMFLVSKDSGETEYLKLEACYAYNKKRHLQKRIEWGEGITGAAWQEGHTVYLTEVPENYVAITSGIGEALPRSILIVPLKVNDEIHGVIELASFQGLESYQIAFVEKLAESIASSISFVKINERTRHLLEDSQQQEEELRAQEEEMRQNMEELKATQEEMQRSTVLMKGVLNAIDQSYLYIEFETDGTILHANANFLQGMGYTMAELKGQHHRIFVGAAHAESKEYQQFLENMRTGISFSGKVIRYTKAGTKVFLQAVYSPVYDNYNTILKVIKIATIVSE